MTRIRLITTDPERIISRAPIPFDADLVRVGDLAQRPPGYPVLLKFPPDEWVGVSSQLHELSRQLRAEPPTDRIAFGISDLALLANPALAEAVQIVIEHGGGADIVVDLGD